MMFRKLAVVSLLAALWGCGPGKEAEKTPESGKESLYQQGHQLYLAQHYDSASALLERSAAMDPGYVEPRTDLADLFYLRAMQEAGGPHRQEFLRKSQRRLVEIEALGKEDSDVYERLCEISLALDDDKAMLKYAKKNALKYPYDRQYFNLGIAYFNAGDYGAVVKSQKEAMGKFPQSPYLGGFYRQTGRAYMKMERNQSATRTFEAGVKLVDARLAVLGNSGAAGESRRLVDDKIAMLLDLRHLHRIYQETAKLEQVERQLREAGYNK